MYRTVTPPVRRPLSDHHLAICKYCTFTMLVPCVDMYARFDPLTQMYDCEWSGDIRMTVDETMRQHFTYAHVEVPTREDVQAGWTYQRIRRVNSPALATAECDYCKTYQFTIRSHSDASCALGASNPFDLHRMKEFHRMACMPYTPTNFLSDLGRSELIPGNILDPPEFHDPTIFDSSRA